LHKELNNYEKCEICNGNSFEVLDTYKHLWVMCLDCKNVKRFRKSKYLLERQPLKTIFKITTKILTPFTFTLSSGLKKPIRQMALDQFLPVMGNMEENEFYKYYSESCKLPYESTKWKIYDDQFLQLLAQVGIDLTGKTILSISEGPGFFAKRLTNVAREIVITELDYKTVEIMRKELRVKAYKYDFNEDRLTDIFHNQKFDLIFMRSCMAFCNDLESLARELAKSINKGGYVFTMFHAATIGGCLQWMHDEYTSNYWYNPETVLRIFRDAEFQSIYPYTKFKNTANPSKKYRRPFYAKILFSPFWWYYFLKSRIKNKHFSRETNEISYSLFLKKCDSNKEVQQ